MIKKNLSLLLIFLSLNSLANEDIVYVNDKTEQALKNYYLTLSKQNYKTYLKNMNPIEVYQKEKNTYENTNENCWAMAGKHYNIDPWILFAYAKTESNFNPNAINKANKNKTYDIGLMQINSLWLPTLSKIGINEKMLYNGCQSVYVAAWIIQNNFEKYGTGYHGIVAYNVGNPYRKGIKKTTDNYYNKFMKNYNSLKIAYKK